MANVRLPDTVDPRGPKGKGSYPQVRPGVSKEGSTPGYGVARPFRRKSRGINLPSGADLDRNQVARVVQALGEALDG
jgi:hypothetical protein